MSEILRENDIKCTMNMKKPDYVKASEKVVKPDNLTVTERKNSPILNEFLDICFKKVKKNEYSDDFKAFSYFLY